LKLWVKVKPRREIIEDGKLKTWWREVEQLENPDRMVFSSEIGAVTDDQELPVYEALLCYNLLWKDTGGVKIGLAGPKGILIVTTELLLDGLTLMSFQEALTNFTNISRSLGKYVVRDKKNPSSLPNVNPHSLHLQA
jgi:hypothetical protein